MRHASNAQTHHDGARAHYGLLSKLKYIILTSNNERFQSAGDNDRRSKYRALRTKFHVSDSQNTRNYITSDGRFKRS